MNDHELVLPGVVRVTLYGVGYVGGLAALYTANVIGRELLFLHRLHKRARKKVLG